MEFLLQPLQPLGTLAVADTTGNTLSQLASRVCVCRSGCSTTSASRDDSVSSLHGGSAHLAFRQLRPWDAAREPASDCWSFKNESLWHRPSLVLSTAPTSVPATAAAERYPPAGFPSCLFRSRTYACFPAAGDRLVGLRSWKKSAGTPCGCSWDAAAPTAEQTWFESRAGWLSSSSQQHRSASQLCQLSEQVPAAERAGASKAKPRLCGSSGPSHMC
jgi:hypothetical protein